MCQECGCSKPGPYQINGQPADDTPAHAHTLADGTVVTHTHDHGHDHPHEAHAHEHDAVPTHQVLDLNTGVLSGNDRVAEQNRGAFRALGVLALNVVSSPGAGKTTLLQKTLTALKDRRRCAVIVGDLATDNDAARLRATGAPAVQIATGTLCHLEAGMVAAAMQQLDLKALDLLIIENVGNLVCPASFDLGEAVRVVLLSVTEGEDKPLKYPPMFHSASVAIVTKKDMADAAGFNRELALANLHRVSHHARIFELSAKTGDGMQPWLDFLAEQRTAVGK